MKLLQRTVRSYLLYSLLVMIVAIPSFYFIIHALCLEDVDDILQDRKEHLEQQLKTHAEILDHLPWHDINNEIEISEPIDDGTPEKKITLQYYSTLSGEEEPFRELHTSVSYNNADYPVTLRISLIDTEDLIQGIVLTVILLMIAILGGLLWINRQQSKKLWKPFYQALNQLQQFTLDKKPDLALAPTNIREFNELHRAIIQLTNRTHRTYLAQREFTENAAHELQTPLAALQAKLELLMQEEAMSPEQAVLIQALGDTVVRMSRLNKGLLLLAKIENNQFTDTREINIISAVKRLLEPLEMQVKLKGLSLSESYQDVNIKANAILVDILLSNLLNNAIQHSLPDGQVIIKTFDDSFEISNSGDPLPFPDENLFHRFKKGNLALSSGNGLGLAIVKQICDTCHYAVSYEYKDNRHRFLIDFNS